MSFYTMCSTYLSISCLGLLRAFSEPPLPEGATQDSPTVELDSILQELMSLGSEVSVALLSVFQTKVWISDLAFLCVEFSQCCLLCFFANFLLQRCDYQWLSVYPVIDMATNPGVYPTSRPESHPDRFHPVFLLACKEKAEETEWVA